MVLVQTASAQTVSTICGVGLHPLVEMSDQGQGQSQIQMLNIFGPGGQILAQVMNGETHYLLADHGRSTRVVCKEDNSPLGNFDYTPYGETSFTGDVDSVTYRYTGQPVNFGLNSYHFHHREYDPGILRFTSIDPARYNESPYIYSNSSPTSFMDPTGGQPTYITLWLSQNVGELLNPDKLFVSQYNSSVLPGHEGTPTQILHEELTLNNRGYGSKGSIFSEDSRLGTIIVSAHGGAHGVDVGEGQYMNPKKFFEHLFRRVMEIDPLGVEQVDSITLFSCKLGCSHDGKPSFASSFLAENVKGKEGESYFPNLERVVSSPYGIDASKSLSSRNLVKLFFRTDRKRNPQKEDGYGDYYADQVKIELDPVQFLRGHGSTARVRESDRFDRYYFQTLERQKPDDIEELEGNNPFSSVEPFIESSL